MASVNGAGRVTELEAEAEAEAETEADAWEADEVAADAEPSASGLALARSLAAPTLVGASST